MPAFDGEVLELGQIYNGPYCGLLLAQLGADVIKVEPPGGEPLRFRSHEPVESHEFVMLNSNKRSVVLDLKTDAGRQALLDLVETADVLIENFAPGTMQRLQLSPQRLLAHNPRLVVASGKGYGSTGPYAHVRHGHHGAGDVRCRLGHRGARRAADQGGAAFVDFSGGIHLFGRSARPCSSASARGKGRSSRCRCTTRSIRCWRRAWAPCTTTPSGSSRTHRERHSGMAVAPYNIYPASDGWLAIICISERHWRGVAPRWGRPS